jgi:hypothetical protein
MARGAALKQGATRKDGSALATNVSLLGIVVLSLWLLINAGGRGLDLIAFVVSVATEIVAIQ